MSASEGNQADSHADDHSHGPPPPPEPNTPMWLPAVGAFLFLMVGLFWALSGPTVDTPESKGSGAASAAPAARPTVTATATQRAANPH